MDIKKRTQVRRVATKLRRLRPPRSKKNLTNIILDNFGTVRDRKMGRTSTESSRIVDSDYGLIYEFMMSDNDNTLAESPTTQIHKLFLDLLPIFLHSIQHSVRLLLNKLFISTNHNYNITPTFTIIFLFPLILVLFFVFKMRENYYLIFVLIL